MTLSTPPKKIQYFDEIITIFLLSDLLKFLLKLYTNICVESKSTK